MTFSVYPVPVYKDGRRPGISSSFFPPDRPDHKGVDIMYPRVPADGGPPGKAELPTLAPRWFMPKGIPAFAMAPGRVAMSTVLGTGGYIVLDHGDGWRSQYMHLADRKVKEGDTVGPGQEIGTVGGDPGYPLIHLHLQIRKNDQLQDPAPILAKLQMLPMPSGGDALLWLTIGGAAGYGLYRYLRAGRLAL